MAPPVPQNPGDLSVWQTPLASQQPFEQVCELHAGHRPFTGGWPVPWQTHWLFVQIWPVPQLMHTSPLLPQKAVVLPGMQLPPAIALQQPVGQVCVEQMQVPLTQC
jgi:hypothetical protein